MPNTPPADETTETTEAAPPPARTPLPPQVRETATPAPVTNPATWAQTRPVGLLAAVALLFVGIYATTFGFMMSRWTHDPAATHGWLVLPIVATVIWYKRERLARIPLGSNNKGLWVMGLALFMHLAEKAIDLNGPSPLSVPIFAAGAVWYFAGTEWLRELAFPLGYLCFMIPIPGGFTEVVSFPLRMLATNGSRAIVSHFGVSVAGSGMHMEFMQPHGTEYISLEVADPCSGLHSLMAIKALHAITAYLTRLKLGWKWVLFMCAIPVALASNLCRMVSIILIGAYVNKTFALGLWHENIAPYLLFGFAFLILISLGKFMEWATGATQREKKLADGPTDPVVAPPTPADVAETPRLPRFKVVLPLLTCALALSLFFTFRPENITTTVADVSAIPKNLGEWVFIQDDHLDPNTMKQIAADSYVSRFYGNQRTGQIVQLLVVYRRYGRREFAHRPELCYPAGGYTIIKKDRTTLPYGGHDAPAVHLIADGSRVALANGTTGVPTTTVSYLFASGDRTECDFLLQQIWMAFERIIPNKNGWTFIRLSTMRRNGNTDEDSFAAQQDFMRVYSPEIQRVITTDTSASPETAPVAGGEKPAPVSATDAFGTFK